MQMLYMMVGAWLYLHDKITELHTLAGEHSGKLYLSKAVFLKRKLMGESGQKIEKSKTSDGNLFFFNG